METNLRTENVKIHRQFPQRWEKDIVEMFSTTNGLVDFSRYTINMDRALKSIKKFYENEFNQDPLIKSSENTIDDYLQIFNNITGKIAKIILDKEYTNGYDFDDYSFNTEFNFCVLSKNDYDKLNKNLFYIKTNLKFKKNRHNVDLLGFNDATYKKLLPLAKEMFMLEKYCSFVTRKFWQKEITSIIELDLKKPFKIITRVLFPENWREGKNKKELEKFYNNKIYESASLIDEQHKINLIFASETIVAALLILEYDEDKFLCANLSDAYSEEYINNKNPFVKKSFYSSVSKINSYKDKDNIHEFFADATEIATPKGILAYNYTYNEVDMKNAKVVGVIAPNEKSVEFAKKEATKRGVPLFVDTNFLKTELSAEKILVW